MTQLVPLRALVLGVMLALLLLPAATAQESGTVNDPDVTPPQIILKTQKAPVFPPAAKAARFSGIVTIEVTVGTDGKIKDLSILDCSHKNVGFEEASLEAVKNWRFDPAMNGEEAVEYTTRFRLNFRGPGTGVTATPYVTAGAVPDPKSPNAPDGSRQPSSPRRPND